MFCTLRARGIGALHTTWYQGAALRDWDFSAVQILTRALLLETALTLEKCISLLFSHVVQGSAQQTMRTTAWEMLFSERLASAVSLHFALEFWKAGARADIFRLRWPAKWQLRGLQWVRDFHDVLWWGFWTNFQYFCCWWSASSMSAA